ncbi:FtsB family cell division protein [Psychrobacillus psychrodurans]|uniref:Septum formation initiator family protein n=1 Tax=Psychrobacillus psychrodurans TaxID=126157 RepID=A0A9X3RBA3_9BACI|nr:septum formation initiator family protein [Psychrobacillus psychrodurans]MCZ8535350.1 septum formation initiator family protein [Psychrobacillus psychrodurans]
MSEKQRNVPVKKQIASINTDYVRSIERQENRNKAKKVRLARRLFMFTILSVALVGFLISTLLNSKSAYEEKQLQKEQVAQELEQVKEEQEMLKVQISKLNDDEYIGKLLRKQYFLSEEGEIIFTLPGKEEK